VSEHKYIWLQPECCADPDEGRHWCQDPDPAECDDGKPWTKYILASEHESLERQLAEVRMERDLALRTVDRFVATITSLQSDRATLQRELEGVRGFTVKAKEYLNGNYPLSQLRLLIEEWSIKEINNHE
jgi:hypothetical protein